MERTPNPKLLELVRSWMPGKSEEEIIAAEQNYWAYLKVCWDIGRRMEAEAVDPKSDKIAQLIYSEEFPIK